jgi:plasmid stabilization system protein ParE
MPSLVWTDEAKADLLRLYYFLAEKNRGAAQRAIAAVRKDVKALNKHPEIGRPASDSRPEMREWVIEFGQGGYVALYWWDGNEVSIIAVRHGKEAGY